MKEQKWAWLAVVFLIGLSLYQAWETERLKFENRILIQAARIDGSQIRELMFIADTARRDVEGEKTRSYLAGFADANSKPELNEIWHSGYDRGTAVGAESARVENAQAARAAAQETLTDAR